MIEAYTRNCHLFHRLELHLPAAGTCKNRLEAPADCIDRYHSSSMERTTAHLLPLVSESNTRSIYDGKMGGQRALDPCTVHMSTPFSKRKGLETQRPSFTVIQA